MQKRRTFDYDDFGGLNLLKQLSSAQLSSGWLVGHVCVMEMEIECGVCLFCN